MATPPRPFRSAPHYYYHIIMAMLVTVVSLVSLAYCISIMPVILRSGTRQLELPIELARLVELIY